ncbi:MAG: hypothetical protein CL967_02145 [Euryarchaeota archaeon]|nr:hypothetical protein [Euryarchaeota archaeon]
MKRHFFCFPNRVVRQLLYATYYLFRERWNIMNSVFEMLLMAIMYVFFIALMIFHGVMTIITG